MNKRFYLFGAVALPLLMASCSNDLLDAEQGSQELVNGNVAKVDSDFRLFAERSTGNQTRGEWINGDKGTVFYWMPAGVVLQEDFANPTQATDHSRVTFAVDPLPVYTPGDSNLKFDEVGLCWLGAGEVGENIFTNYKFVHDGWLEDGATTASDEIVDCNQTTAEYLKNWNWVKYVGDYDTYGTSAVDWAAEGKKLTITPETGKVVGALGAKVNAYDKGAWKVPANQHQIEKINLSKGTFRTENKSIFTGKYLAYYPYDEAMVEQGRLVAKTVTEQDAPIGYNDRMLQAGDYTFLAGYMAEEIKGGSVASALTMNPISGLLSVKLDNATCASDIQHMIVMSAKGEIAETMGLKASAIKAGNELDGADVTKTQKVIVHFKDKDGNPANFRFDNYNTNPPGKLSNEDTYNRVIVPVLPSEISDLDLFLVTTSGKAQTTKNTQKVTVNKGAAVGVATGSVNNDIYVAWDKESLKKAINNAGDATGPQTILIINKIVLDETIVVPGNLTITGEWRNQKVGELVVAASNTSTPNVLAARKGAAFNCDITVEGVGCCHKIAGIMDAQGITFKAGTYADGHKNKLLNNGLVTFTNTGDLCVNKFDGDIENTPLKYKVAGVPTVDPATGVAYQIPFEAEDYSFDFDDPFKFKGSVIAIYTLATVEINSTLNNNTTSDEAGNARRRDALVILEKRDDSIYRNNNQDARLVINEEAVVDNFATVKNQATIANNSGKAAGFKNEVHATFVNMIGGQLNGYKMQKEANSNFIAQVDNSIDSRYTTALQEHLANIIEFLPLNGKYSTAPQAMTYTMEGVNNKDLKYLINAGTETVTLVGKKSVDAPKATVEATIGAIEVAAGCQLDINYSQGTYINTTSPVCLNVENGIYNNTHKKDVEGGVLINNRYPVDIPAVITDASSSKFNLYTNCWDGVTFNTVGNVEFNGVEFIGQANTDGFNLPIVTVKGNMTVAGVTTVDQKVVKGTVDGKLTIASTGTMNFNSDVKFKVGVDKNTTVGEIENNGTFNIESNVIFSSPAIVYCKSYNLTGGTWLNGGRPTPFDAGGVVPEDYNW